MVSLMEVKSIRTQIFLDDIIGVFTNNDLEFDSQRGAKTVRFTGTITSDTTISLTYFGRMITLRKGNP